MEQNRLSASSALIEGYLSFLHHFSDMFQLLQNVTVEIDRSASQILKQRQGQTSKIVLTIESEFFVGCCGYSEEKTVKVELAEQIKDASRFVVAQDGVLSIYIQRELLASVKDAGNKFTIFADANGELYCNLNPNVPVP